MRDIKSFNPDNDVHHFITDLNQAYTINLKPDIARYPEMEEQFMKIAKRLLNQGITRHYKVDYQLDIFGFKQLKLYLTATQNNQMSNFQHLSQA